MMNPLPESTYRLQFHAGFAFDQAAAIVPYLADLGVTHAYASPYFRATPGSTHGYDVIDHCSINPELGGEPAFERWVSELSRHHLSHILDTVPNHVGVATNDNAWWNDVLEHGPASPFAHHFDIAWRGSPRPELHDKLLLPSLGSRFGQVLEKGELKVVFDADAGAFHVQYYERRFPLAPRTYPDALDSGEGQAPFALKELVEAFRALHSPSDIPPEQRQERRDEARRLKSRLRDLAADQNVRAYIDRNLASFNGTPGQPGTFDRLEALLDRQCYRLAYWRTASDEINYRRFFDINELAALGMEHADVFDAAHALVFRLIAEGKLAGLRIDHPDGLYDPAQYFRRLQERFAKHLGGSTSTDKRPDLPLYVVAEKILALDESLPDDWRVHGTSGYDFLNMINGLFVAAENEDAFTRVYREFTGDTTSFEDHVYAKKKLILSTSLASELHMLAHRLDRLARRHRHWRDFTFAALSDGLVEMIACFPVYRTYVADERAVSPADTAHVRHAVREAERRNPKTDPAVFHFIRDAVLQRYPNCYAPSCDSPGPARAEQLRFAGKFQQLSAPATAKGVEDTAFYVYHRLISLNEVGGEPGRFGLHPDDVHAYLADRAEKWPFALSVLSTHDTKRSEDVRARINVLSELPDEWRAHLARWSELNAPLRRTIDAHPAPAPDEEYLLYQTLVGAWPLSPSEASSEEFCSRIQAYMTKAMREAKLRTSWTDPDDAHESAVSDFVADVLATQKSRPFLDSFLPFQRRISHLGMINSLSQTLLRLASPGVPDAYQGTELWDFSLVDPDNRRCVDFTLRQHLLAELRSRSADPDRAAFVREILEAKEDGRVKLFVNLQALTFRRDHPGLLSSGSYTPLRAAGRRAGNVFAFSRRHQGRVAVVVVPRLTASLHRDGVDRPLGESCWEDTWIDLADLAGGHLRNLFTHETRDVGNADSRDGPRLRVGDLLKTFPVALLAGDVEEQSLATQTKMRW